MLLAVLNFDQSSVKYSILQNTENYCHAPWLSVVTGMGNSLRTGIHVPRSCYLERTVCTKARQIEQQLPALAA